MKARWELSGLFGPSLGGHRVHFCCILLGISKSELSSDFKGKRIRSHISGRRVKVKSCGMGENVAAIFGKYNLPWGGKQQFIASPLSL